MKKRIVCFLAAIILLANSFPAFAAYTDYSDVPADHWAAEYINKATQLGLINGMGNGLFGTGQNVTRAQFAAMLVRLFAWQTQTPKTPSFSDNQDKSKWYYSDIETALANGAVTKDTAAFRPNVDITREEMAVMLVRALGYETLAASASGYGVPFTDVTQNVGYITLAYNFGMIKGIDGNNVCAKQQRHQRTGRRDDDTPI